MGSEVMVTVEMGNGKRLTGKVGIGIRAREKQGNLCGGNGHYL